MAEDELYRPNTEFLEHLLWEFAVAATGRFGPRPDRCPEEPRAADMWNATHELAEELVKRR